MFPQFKKVIEKEKEEFGLTKGFHGFEFGGPMGDTLGDIESWDEWIRVNGSSGSGTSPSSSR